MGLGQAVHSSSQEPPGFGTHLGRRNIRHKLLRRGRRFTCAELMKIDTLRGEQDRTRAARAGMTHLRQG